MNREKSLVGYRIPGTWPVSIFVICCALLFAAGCTSPQQAGVMTGDTIQVFYVTSLSDGTVFESNLNGTPLTFTVGSGSVIQGLHEMVIGMTPGQTRTVTVPPDKGYGMYREDMVNVMDRGTVTRYLEELQNNNSLDVIEYPVIGPVALWVMPDGGIGYLRFTNITDQTITVDENHPLAGKDLVFTVTLVGIENKTA
jgi:peptidylprolyl isomerase